VITHRVTGWRKFSGPGTVTWVFRYLKPADRRVRFGRGVEGMGFAEQPLQPELLEIEADAASHRLDAQAASAIVGPGDMQMHVRVLTERDLVGAGEADRAFVVQPGQQQGFAALQRLLEDQRVVGPPVLPLGKTRWIHADQFQMLRGRRMEIVDDQIDLGFRHFSNHQVHGPPRR
jgi:hypothetical protein